MLTEDACIDAYTDKKGVSTYGKRIVYLKCLCGLNGIQSTHLMHACD